MYALCVTIHVKPEAIVDFISLTETQVRHTRQERGNLRYDCLKSTDGLFIIYEVYESDAAFQIHRTAPHTIAWKTATEPMLRQPRSAVRGQALFHDSEKP